MIDVSLDFMPAFYHRQLGLKWGEAYYFDPEFRAKVDATRDRYLYEILGRYGVGSPNPRPATSLFIQPIDLFMRTQGAEWRFPEDGTVESWGKPWQGLSLADIEALTPDEAAMHPVVDAIIAQYHELRKLYGDQADVLGLRSGRLNMHSPYTTAHQLMGEELFLLMSDNPQAARKIFAKVWDIYQAVFERIARAIDAPRFNHVILGDCAASMVSPALYRECILPVNMTVADAFPGCTYHSCGISTHLLGEFARLPRMKAVQLGPGTDLRLAHQRIRRHACLQPLLDPVLVRDGTQGEVSSLVAAVVEVLQERGDGLLCAWSFDAATPVGNVAAIYETVAERNATKNNP